mmetsp:Transcript_45187/g.142256  ORF Transcript_45187/g.142256 Transcript_45187/m.142256 type:complete len:302 (-) Transcript_45187:1388-2293(-)
MLVEFDLVRHEDSRGIDVACRCLPLQMSLSLPWKPEHPKKRGRDLAEDFHPQGESSWPELLQVIEVCKDDLVLVVGEVAGSSVLRGKVSLHLLHLALTMIRHHVRAREDRKLLGEAAGVVLGRSDDAIGDDEVELGKAEGVRVPQVVHDHRGRAQGPDFSVTPVSVAVELHHDMRLGAVDHLGDHARVDALDPVELVDGVVDGDKRLGAVVGLEAEAEDLEPRAVEKAEETLDELPDRTSVEVGREEGDGELVHPGALVGQPGDEVSRDPPGHLEHVRSSLANYVAELSIAERIGESEDGA